MNLKEAFRFQNKLQKLMDEAQSILGKDENVTCVQNTYLRKKVMVEAENETTIDAPTTDYGEKITVVAGFLLNILDEREKLARAIRVAKNSLPIDMDSEVSLNSKRQEIARLFQHMTDLRSSEVLISNGGMGYRFNAEGNQVSYRCDVKRVVTINFDRNVIRKYASDIHRKSDSTSAELDRCLVNAEVNYAAPFDVNDSFADIFEAFANENQL